MATVEQSLIEELEQIGKQARQASDVLRSMSSMTKDAALHEIAKNLRQAKNALMEENAKDLAAGTEKGLL